MKPLAEVRASMLAPRSKRVAMSEWLPSADAVHSGVYPSA